MQRKAVKQIASRLFDTAWEPNVPFAVLHIEHAHEHNTGQREENGGIVLL